MDDIKVRIWLDDDAHDGNAAPPFWEGTREQLGGVVPDPGDTLTFPRPGNPAGALVAVVEDFRAFIFGPRNRTSDGPAYPLVAIDLDARSET